MRGCAIRKDRWAFAPGVAVCGLIFAETGAALHPAITPGGKETRQFRSVAKPIVTAVKERFAPVDVATVLGAFNHPKHSGVYERPRVQAAVIILCGGDMVKFRNAMKDAQTDWRDVLVWSGLGHADWPEVAAKKGIAGLRKLFASPETR